MSNRISHSGALSIRWSPHSGTTRALRWAMVTDVTRVIDAMTPEQAEALDHWSEQLQGLLHTAVEQGGPAGRRLKNWLNGVWLGHALHPALTDVPLGAWSTG